MPKVDFKIGDLVEFNQSSMHGKGVIVGFDNDGDLLVKLLGSLAGRGHYARGGYDTSDYWFVRPYRATKTDNRIMGW